MRGGEQIGMVLEGIHQRSDAGRIRVPQAVFHRAGQDVAGIYRAGRSVRAPIVWGGDNKMGSDSGGHFFLVIFALGAEGKATTGGRCAGAADRGSRAGHERRPDKVLQTP